jgi:hypothetical protein
VSAIVIEVPGTTGRPGGPAGPAADQRSPGPGAADQPTDRGGRTMRSWPLLVLAAPAAAEVWSGWVGVARMTGFGMVSPLPGIWPSLRLDTSVTLPVGVECYAALALRAWLSGGDSVSQRTRRFARNSAICSLVLGMAGQVAYHLLAQAGTARAPWPVTTIVSCLPVLVLAMGTMLAHMLREDAGSRDTEGPGATITAPRSSPPPDRSRDHPGPCPGQRPRSLARSAGPDRRTFSPRRPCDAPDHQTRPRRNRAEERPGPHHRTQARHRRETGVTAGTAQRRRHGVQRGLEQARAGDQLRTGECGARPCVSDRAGTSGGIAARRATESQEDCPDQEI